MNNNQPFFAQFMQTQELTAEQTGQVSGGVTRDDQRFVTQKAPSDDDEGSSLEWPPKKRDDLQVTQKFPSDGDEDSNIGFTS